MSEKKEKKKVRKINTFDVNKARSPAGMDSFRSLVAATALRKTHPVNKVRMWRDGSWWSPYYEAHPVLPSVSSGEGEKTTDC